VYTLYTSLVLDTSLLVYVFVNTKYFQQINSKEKIKECIARNLFYRGKHKILIPSLIAEVELRRVLAKMIIIKGVTSEDKLLILSNTIKYIEEIFGKYKALILFIFVFACFT